MYYITMSGLGNQHLSLDVLHVSLNPDPRFHHVYLYDRYSSWVITKSKSKSLRSRWVLDETAAKGLFEDAKVTKRVICAKNDWISVDLRHSHAKHPKKKMVQKLRVYGNLVLNHFKILSRLDVCGSFHS